ncbi:precorrin-8X methylmutase [Corynebacterium pseudotuberculosis]|uniref:Precorrin-8X methylmutase n=1 Tax=Corynebacterium pseudotuberculosis (strain C231) TaxID=681645 RepID=D9QAC1_CORP2|nr:precorrin-8X methylmutase [Corynebacterium pseudotuberculosis]ADK28818.1 precorrin-8X methylmutase [Corynebacterium pseudotuberculosis FRC41]ADL10497.1 precorrin-8X methylmutase [Corynebacterium pseudotuberculosis C231]ADO26294.1 precorrin-8X methylmutase [Corynebacterium pseudotuberculosis I19]AEK92355.1 Precorrin-8X methyl mutase [Corynebacterium pseudotuberculosis PAT10]AEP70269.1 Precorrin-8X methyl mutase [Corynebacterium pseudotuberculosis 42/02-A]
MSFDYITDGNEIYRQSFAMIREESDLSNFDPDQAQVAVRMIHAAGEVDLAEDIEFSANLVPAARSALKAGAPIFTDVNMVKSGITRKRLPVNNDVICLLTDKRIPDLAARLGTTRSAAAVELWAERLDGAIVAIGNAPTALFHLMNWLAEDPTRPRPAAIIGIPVGFVGAAESKAALSNVAADLGTEFVTVHGRRGGSAITCAAINALATEKEILP